MSDVVDGPSSQWRSGVWRVRCARGDVDVCWRARGDFIDLPPFARGDLVDPADPRPPARTRVPDHRGRLTALRSPVETSPPTPPPVLMVEQLTEPSPAGGFPWAALLPGVFSGAVAALVFNPLFALLAVGSVLAFVGRWAAGVSSHRRATRAHARTKQLAEREREHAADRWLADERRRRDDIDPSLLMTWTREQRTPWHARLDGDLRLTVGRGTTSETVVLVEQDGASTRLTRTARSMPLDVVLGAGRGLAVVGDRASALDAARWLISSACALHGPADLGLVLLTTKDRVDQWDWVKWLPSLVTVAVDPAEIEAALGGSVSAEGKALVLVVVDGPEPVGPSALARLVAGSMSSVRLLWLGDRDGVPAGCQQRLRVTADAGCVVDDLVQPCGPVVGDAFVLDETSATQAARWLAPFDDPEHVTSTGRLPTTLALADLTGIDDRDARARIQRSWHKAGRSHLRVPLGRDQHGDRWLDLVHDGPHALVAGTTGSGKSELLRTVVAGLAIHQPPDLVSFVLIDFKGGGAFDAVGNLPHVAAVVTDLDRAEAGRALRGLQAELIDREHRLRGIGVSDVGDVPIDHPAGFARMVVIVDEFAALADELPDFLDGLVDIARRGRSLGVHLILATQRPAGVVTGEIRANASLRICLRVQDRADSIDVIDTAAAADLPRVPGRALLRCGSSAISDVQVAHLGGPPGTVSVEPFVVHPALLEDARGGAGRRRAADAAQDALLGTDERPASEGGIDLGSLLSELVEPDVRPTPPWQPPLSSLTWTEVRAGGEVPSSTMGMLDDPDHRCRRPLVWSWSTDGLLIVGADRSDVESTVVTAVVSLLGDRDVPDVFVVDGGLAQGGGAGLRHLDVVPAVGDVISVSETARVAKLIVGLERETRSTDSRTSTVLVIHGWGPVCDALEAELGPSGPALLTRLVSRVGAGLGVVVTATSDREVPSRVTSTLALRILHRLADSTGYLTFGIGARHVPELGVGRVIVPGSDLCGVVARVEPADLDEVAGRLAADDPDRNWPNAIRVLGERVDRIDLPPARQTGDDVSVPIGLDLDLGPHRIVIGPRRPVIVLGQPGSGRSTALATIAAALPADSACVVIDDADERDETEIADLVEAGRRNGLVIAATPQSARSFGSWIAPLLASAQVVFLNPQRGDGEVCRASVPDLSRAPSGRAAVVDRGRVAVVQIAA